MNTGKRARTLLISLFIIYYLPVLIVFLGFFFFFFDIYLAEIGLPRGAHALSTAKDETRGLRRATKEKKKKKLIPVIK